MFSVPALAYQTVVPLWQRTKQFANAYFSAGIDFVFSIFWVGALGAAQVWTNSGITDGGKSYCDNFSFGDKDKCVISYGTVLIAVLVFLLWILALAIAVYLLLFYRRNGYLPNSRPSISNPSIIEPKFSVSTDGSNLSRGASKPELHVDPNRDVEAGFAHTATPHGTHPGRKVSWGASPPLTAPSRFEAGGSQPQFNPVTYRRGGSPDEKTPLSPSKQGPRTAMAPSLQVWPPSSDAHPSRSFATAYGTLAANGPVTADVRRLPFQQPGAGWGGLGADTSSRSFAYDANRRPSIRNNAASVHTAGYSTAHNTPLATPVPGSANPWARS